MSPAAPEVAPDAPEPQPIWFGPGGGLFGLYHPPAGAARGAAVLLCAPLGYEGICANRSFRHLALRLSAEGFPVLRFDYAGTGNSSGSDADPGRVEAWLASVGAAASELRARSGTQRLALAGVRVGALLAAWAAPSLEVDSLVLWAATPSGRAWVREIKAFAGMRQREAGGASGDVESAGFLITSGTAEGLARLELGKLSARPARRVLVLGRDDLPAEPKFAAHFESLGAQVERRDLPGYQAMMAYPHLSRVPHQVWSEVVGWLSADSPRASAAAAPPPGGPAELLLPGVRETAVRFGEGGRLFGILSEPADGPRADTAVLTLTMASHHQIGPNRLHTRWARQLAARGWPVLRFDVSGTGESLVNHTGIENAPYALDQVADVSAAMDLLAARGSRRFVAAGFCSGAFLAFHTALADPRLGGVVLINPQTFIWKPGDSLDIPQSSTTAEYKSSLFYGRALLRSETWKRVLRGEVNVRGISAEVAARMAGRLKERARRAWARVTDPENAASPVLRWFRQALARGTDVLLIYGDEDPGLDYLAAHVGNAGGPLRGEPRFGFRIIEGGSEHTFGQMWAQELISQALEEHLRARFPVTDGRQA